MIPFHADRQLDYGKQVFYRGGYLFLQSIYYQMQMNKICRKLKQKYYAICRNVSFQFDLHLIFILHYKLHHPPSVSTCDSELLDINAFADQIRCQLIVRMLVIRLIRKERRHIRLPKYICFHPNGSSSIGKIPRVSDLQGMRRLPSAEAPGYSAIVSFPSDWFSSFSVVGSEPPRKFGNPYCR